MKSIANTLNILFAVAVIFSSCKKSDTPPVPPINPPGVYAAGYSVNAAGYNFASYWVNDKKFNLVADTANLTGDSRCIDMAFAGEDLYIVGEEHKNGINRIVLWKNGAATYITPPGLTSKVTGLEVIGNDVYICGAVISGSDYIATYWKNGALVTLGNGAESECLDMAVSGTDVYIVGFDAGFVNRWRYWKNGIPTVIPVPNPLDTYLTCIAVSGNDIYTAGNLSIAPGVNEIIGFKNNVLTAIASPIANTQSNVSDMEVSNGTIYLGGITLKPGQYTATTTWNNGTASILGNGMLHSSAGFITVSGNDMYVAGFENNSPPPVGRRQAAYWKNGVKYPLANGTTETRALSIKIKQ